MHNYYHAVYTTVLIMKNWAFLAKNFTLQIGLNFLHNSLYPKSERYYYLLTALQALHGENHLLKSHQRAEHIVD